jgi:hypothetical protein
VLHLLHGIWVASCPTCGFQLTTARTQAAASAGPPAGLLGTTSIAGTATAMRALADALVQAAELADAYDADPDAYNQREATEQAIDP